MERSKPSQTVDINCNTINQERTSNADGHHHRQRGRCDHEPQEPGESKLGRATTGGTATCTARGRRLSGVVVLSELERRQGLGVLIAVQHSSVEQHRSVFSLQPHSRGSVTCNLLGAAFDFGEDELLTARID
jgi:hypothetical protein